MNTTKILGEAVGIQSQGTVDKTETPTNEGLTSALIIGRFMRGRVDKPMTIHQGNIRGQLGYQPDNFDYIAVQDCLDTGVPSVQVLRVGPESNSPLISCAGATSMINFPSIRGNWRFYIDDFESFVLSGLANDFTYYLNTEMSGKLTGDFDGFFWIENLEMQPHRFKMVPLDGEVVPDFTAPTDNPTFIAHEDGSLTFCLSASLNIQECNPTVLTIPDFVIPDVMAVYTYSYRINGGEIITTTENAGGAPSQTVFTNIMAYYGLFSELVTNDIGQKAFRAKYGEPIRGGSITDPNFIQTQSNTIEFLLTENAEHDLIETIFGHSITLHSCAIVNWV
nr:hypothetical protein [Acinetobacter beijerinckii]